MRHIMRYVFRYLIFQSNIGLDYMEKFNAWKNVSIYLKYKIIFSVCDEISQRIFVNSMCFK